MDDTDLGVPHITRIDPVELIDGMVACSREQIGDHCPLLFVSKGGYEWVFGSAATPPLPAASGLQ